MPWAIEQAASAPAGAPASSGAVRFQVRLWPHQSLSGTGYVWVMGLMASFAMMPLVALVGTVALWGMIPFAMGAVAALAFSLRRSWRDRDIVETFTLTRGRAALVRVEPDGRRLEWEANPHWVRVVRHPKVGRVEDYLTLRGGPREVEIGAFLTPPERRALEGRLAAALSRAR